MLQQGGSEFPAHVSSCSGQIPRITIYTPAVRGAGYEIQMLIWHLLDFHFWRAGDLEDDADSQDFHTSSSPNARVSI